MALGLAVAGVTAVTGAGLMLASQAAIIPALPGKPDDASQPAPSDVGAPKSPTDTTSNPTPSKPSDKPGQKNSGLTGSSAKVQTSKAADKAATAANPSAVTPPTPPSPTPVTPPSPSGQSAPIGDLPGWKQTFVDDFTVDAPLGSWATNDGDAVVYTGDHGGKWTVYPDGWSSTYSGGQPGYQPGQVLSVHDGQMDFWLRDINGLPSGANPSPFVNTTSRYQTYGRYTARLRADPGLTNYHAAWLLWPRNDVNGGCAESDFPEGGLDSTASAFAHNATDCSNYSVQDAFSTSTRFDSGWHTYTQEWSPGLRKYYIDGQLIGTSTTRVWSQEARWQLQTEPDGNTHASGHLMVDWVAVYAYDP